MDQHGKVVADKVVRAMLSTILDCVDEGIHIVDADGRTIFYNSAAGKLDGLQCGEVLGRHVLEVFPSLSASTSTLLNVVRTGVPILNQQQTFTNFKGHRVTTINSTVPIVVDGAVVAAVEVSRDITQVKRMSEKIVDLQRELLGKKDGVNDAGHAERLYTFDDIIGQDPRMVRLKALAQKAARTSSSVLVYGETGTGKELLVQAIHTASQRRKGPFVAQNCAAVPESLLEGLLFGTTRGGFTGARDRPGLFELAHGGTLYLDEVNSMPLGLQAKLLRAIQEKAVMRLGDTRLRKVDVRIIASTSTEPSEAVRRRELRSDLYYRLNVVSLAIPPLRERRGDIPILADHFIARFNKAMGTSVERLDGEAMAACMAYDWPGNVRELEHAIEGAMNVVDGPAIGLEHLPPSVASAWRGLHFGSAADRDPLGDRGGLHDRRRGSPVPLKHDLVERERSVVAEALKANGGNISRTAKALGLPRQTLQYRIRVLGLQDLVPNLRRLPGSGQKGDM